MAIGTDIVARKYLNPVAGTPISVDIPTSDKTTIEVLLGESAEVAVQDTDYTVTLNTSTYADFTLTPTAAMRTKIDALVALGEADQIVVRRTLSYLSDMTAELAFFRQKIATEFDKTIMRFQQVAEKLGRCLTFATVDVDADGELPTLLSMEGKFLAVAGGKIVATSGTTEVPISVAMEPVCRAPSLAAGRVALELGTAATTNAGEYDPAGSAESARSYAESIVPNSFGNCYLSYVSPTQIKLSPKDGNLLSINGVRRTIPSAGVTLANTGLNANTLYYVYAYMNGATMTLEASVTGHTTHTDGIEIKAGDPSESLVGAIYTGAGTPGVFQSAPLILSWYNRKNITSFLSLGSDQTSSSASFNAVPGTKIQYLAWGSSYSQMSFSGSVTCTTGSGVTLMNGLGHNSTSVNSGTLQLAGIVTYTTPYNFSSSFGCSETEGLNYVTGLSGVYSGGSSPNVVTVHGSATTVTVQG